MDYNAEKQTSQMGWMDEGRRGGGRDGATVSKDWRQFRPTHTHTHTMHLVE